MRIALPALFACLLLTGAPAARAAESYDNCTGYLTSLPAVISTQGTWCMDKDLATTIGSGSAVTINTNNVTLDCNHFKLGGLGAGAGTTTTGIFASTRSNITIRNCNVRGFLSGISLQGVSGAGHIIEDNRLEANTFVGARVEGSGSVRRNFIVDTGDSLASEMVNAYGIWTSGDVDVIDNTITGVITSDNGSVNGIVSITASGATIAGNRIRGLDTGDLGSLVGIQDFNSSRQVIRDNHIIQFDSGESEGIVCGSSDSVALGNVISGFFTNVVTCVDGGNTNIP